MKPKIEFTYLDQNWILWKRDDKAGSPWLFTPPWGERTPSGTLNKKWHTLKDKTTGANLDDNEAKTLAKTYIAARFNGPKHYEVLRDENKLRDALTVTKILLDYKAAGCPDSRGKSRLAAETRNIDMLTAWWGSTLVSRITNPLRDAYREHRRVTVKMGDGGRTTELELGTLNNALKWAWQAELLRDMPRSMKCSYVDPDKVVHRREQMPSCGDELHAIAAWCFTQATKAEAVRASDRPNGRNFRRPATWETFGWAILLLGLTGIRVGEAAMLLANPKRNILANVKGNKMGYPPGHIDDEFLRITREKKGSNPKVALDDDTRPHIAPLLKAIREWHAVRYPGHRYLLPGLGADKQLDGRALGKVIDAATEELGIGKRCPHGLRAYYSTVRLAQGKLPDTVAQELGQSSGDELVRDVYGADPDEFDVADWISLAEQFTWVPNTADKLPAWNWWTAQDQPVSNIVALG